MTCKTCEKMTCGDCELYNEGFGLDFKCPQPGMHHTYPACYPMRLVCELRRELHERCVYMDRLTRAAEKMLADLATREYLETALNGQNTANVLKRVKEKYGLGGEE